MMLVDLVLSVVLALIFVVSGGVKLAGRRQVVESFDRWGYPPSVRIAGGVLELTGAGLLLVPALTLYGVVVLIGVLLTALYTHFVRERIPKHAIGPFVLLVLIVVIGLLRGPLAFGLGGDIFRALF